METPADGQKINGSLNLFWLKSRHGKLTIRGTAGLMQRQGQPAPEAVSSNINDRINKV